MRLFTYILRSDTGFAPNPFWGFCTLACCKPAIRRVARVGDLVIGLSPKSHGHRLAYAMEVTEVVPFPEYWRDPRFAAKRPQWKSPKVVQRCGDNCYEPLADRRFRQLPSIHSMRDGTENTANMQRDLSGERVLISMRFWYFGASAVPLPADLSFAIVGRGQRSKFAEEQIQAFRGFLSTLPPGIHGPPAMWKAGDTSFMQKPSKVQKRRCR